MKKTVIRPFGIVSALVLLVALFLLFSSCILVIKEKNIFNFLFVVFYSYMIVSIFYMIFKPKIILYEDKITIYHWGKENEKDMLFKLPKTIKTTIYYKDLAQCGAFLVDDIKNYLEKDSGFLKEQWFLSSGGNIRIPLKMPKAVNNLREVLLFADKAGNITVIDANPYSKRQAGLLLAFLENRSNIKPSGMVEADHKHKPSFALDVFKAYLTLFIVTLWCVILPVSLIWLEGIFNPSHTPNYQSVFRHIYVLGFMFANITSVGVFLLYKKEYRNTGPDLTVVKKIFKVAALILYPVSIVSFICSVLF